MRELSPNSPLLARGLKLGETVDESVARYQALDGQEFSREDLQNLLSRGLSAEEAKTRPVWRVLAGNDEALLKAYVDAGQLRERLGKLYRN